MATNAIEMPCPELAVSFCQQPPGAAMDVYHCHPGYELYYQMTGSSQCHVGGTACQVHAGNLLLLAPGQPHRAEAVGNGPSAGAVLLFDDACLAPIRAAFPQADVAACFGEEGARLCPLEGPQQTAVESALYQIRALQARDDTAGPAAAKLLLGALLLALRPLCAAHAAAGAGPAAARLAVQAEGYIGAHFAQPLTLPVLAQRFGVSPCYLSRAFKQGTGLGFNAYLNAVRVKAAQALMRRQPALGLAEVGRQCGFGTGPHFRRAFRAVAGLTPQQYRKRCRQEAPKNKAAPAAGGGGGDIPQGA